VVETFPTSCHWLLVARNTNQLRFSIRSKLSFTCATENSLLKVEDADTDGHVNNIQIRSSCEVERLRGASNFALSQLGDIDTPLIIIDLSKLLIQFNRWKKCLPNIHPYYAVKCNPDPVVVQFLQNLGCNFDCATKAEMELVVNQLGHDPAEVVFSNPCKLESHIRYADSIGVNTTIIDNHDEVSKIKRCHPNAKVLIRLACSDASGRSPMSLKFGASRDQVGPLLEHAASVGLPVVGVHFHVGSGCSDPKSYKKALMDARRAFDIGSELGHDMHIVDIGGGFPGLNVLDGSCQTSNGVHFEEMARIINSMVNQLFPKDSIYPQYKIIAEPGRFFGQAAQALVNKVMGKSVVGTCPSEDGQQRKLIRYYMTEGLYGTLSCIIFDQQDSLKPILLNEKENDGPCPVGTMFGPTCDGFDKIGELTNLPELEIGDRLLYLQFGAYTSSITTRFNGFDPATVFYYQSV
jgi:ornithine decarboxylase